MATGKQRCRILKEIRQRIADLNGLEFVTSECRYTGDCKGTCPKCEAEVRFIEEQLRARSITGQHVMLAGVSAGMIFLAGCTGNQANIQSDPAESPTRTEIIEESVGDHTEMCDIQEKVEVSIDSLPAEQRKPVTELLIVGGIEDEMDEPTIMAVDFTEGVGEIADKPVGIWEDEAGQIMKIWFVDQKPEFLDGEDALYQWLKENINYPEAAVEKGIQGRVVVEFIVESDGSVSNVKVARQRYPELDAEAVRVVESMPKWMPARHEGEAVRVKYTLPVTFKLPD